MKYAIRIVSGAAERTSLFAIVEDKAGNVTRYYNLAKKSIPQYSSDYVSIKEWRLDK